VIVDKFTKWGYFILYSESMILEKLAKIYIKKVFVRHRVLTKIIFNKNKKFILKF
jgi:hypothetical protein